MAKHKPVAKNQRSIGDFMVFVHRSDASGPALSQVAAEAPTTKRKRGEEEVEEASSSCVGVCSRCNKGPTVHYCVKCRKSCHAKEPCGRTNLQDETVCSACVGDDDLRNEVIEYCEVEEVEVVNLEVPPSQDNPVNVNSCRGTAAGEETTVPSDLSSSQTSGPAQPRNLRFPSVKTRVIRTGRFGRNGTRNFCGWNIVSNGMRCFATPADYFLTENPRRKCFALLESANGTLQGQSVSKACAVS